MEDISIEITEAEVTAGRGGIEALPENFVTVGEIDKDSIRIYIRQNVYKRIEKFAMEEMSREVGSILVGDFMEEDGRISVVISDFIEAKYTDSTASTLTFTHETWEYVYGEMDKKYPDKKIVGWQHTHPGYGIFLSSYDVFIQENFFNLPWQVAYVVDPIADRRGFFEWKQGKISQMSGFYVYDEVGRVIKIAEKAKPKKRQVSLSNIILSFLLVASMLVSVYLGMEKSSMEKRLKEALDSEKKTVIHTDKPPQEEKKPQGDTESFYVYTVESGDGLMEIMDRFHLDYRENIGKIMKINGIVNANNIYAGQTLYLPMNK